MKIIAARLAKNPQVSDYKINVSQKESFELFFVKGKLETVRCTDTCDKQVTVYADHGEYKGDAQFFVYPSTTEAEIDEKIASAVENALLINNAAYTLPQGEQGEYQVESNLDCEDIPALASRIAETVFAANTMERGSLNSVEIFINRHTDTVVNSRGLHKVQHRYDAMVEAIPTYNGENQSVELYEQYNFGNLDVQVLKEEIASRMEEVQARYQAVKPDFPVKGKVLLHKLELSDLFSSFVDDLNYATVYGHSNLYHKGDQIQKNPRGDVLTLRMKGQVPGNVCSSAFDSDGMTLGETTLISRGTVENYYGSNRFGQYLEEKPTGSLRCLCVDPGQAPLALSEGEDYLEVMSMSGLQVDLFNNYIGGEVRLAYYHHQGRKIPVTGVSVSGKLDQVLDSLVLSDQIAVHDSYVGPDRAVLDCMTIF